MTGASIYSLADGAHAKLESAQWARFSAPASTADFCNSWLALLCAQVDRPQGGLVLLGPGQDGSYSPAASWPDASHNLLHLGPTAQATLQERRGIVHEGTSPATTAAILMVGYPIEVDGLLHGAVVLEIKPRPESEVQRVLRQLHWGSAWLVDQFRRQIVTREQQRAERLSLASQAVATALQEKPVRAAALAVANELAGRLGCERVAVGFSRHDSCEVQAISHTATFDARSDFVRLLAEAMDEVLDLGQPQVHPPLDPDAVGGLAHAALSSARGEASVLSVPLLDDRDPVGVLTLERKRDRPFEAAELELCETIGQLLGPVFALQQSEQRSTWRRASDGMRHGATALFGPRHPGLKLVSLLLLATVLVFSFATWPYRVSSKVVIEGSVQRAMVAPFQGFVGESFVRAGDAVRAGQPLARLEDRELKLERVKWLSEAEQMQRRYRQAAAAQERAAMTVAAAQEQQAQAQLALVEERLARATLKAPFEGIVVSGDLSQLLGSPVEQGKVLFEVAPLDAYRVVLHVDERDIAELALGQRGQIALAGMPYERLSFTVRQITPISTAQEGRNYFRVEARLDQATTRLRPGMEGVGKVEVGDRKLIWIWTHSLVEWLQLASWRWLG
jgi:RND family efflux transporter MFP subunit